MDVSTAYTADTELPSASARADRIRTIVRWRFQVAMGLTSALTAIWVGFILTVYFAKAFLSLQIVGGVSIALALAASVIVAGWLLGLVYIIWANGAYSAALRTIE